MHYVRLLAALVFLSFSYVGHSQSDSSLYTSEHLAWLKANLVEVKSRQTVFALKADDLSSFGNWLTDVKVVGLGEDTHGTREFYQLKAELIKYLVREKGFTLVAIEDNLPEIGKLNELLLGGSRSTQEYQKYISQHLQYKEYFELFHWIREYNQTAAEKVQLYGIDMQSARTAIDVVSDVIGRTKHRGLMQQTMLLRNDLNEAYEFIEGKKQAGSGDKKKHMRTILRQSRSLLRMVDRKKAAIVSATSGEDYKWLSKNLQVIIAFTKLTSGVHTPVFNTAVNRDMQMADNVAWILKKHPGKKVIVWAHNGHVHKDLNRGEGMGYFLKKKYGRSYFSIGLLSAQGSYAAFDPVTRQQGVYTLPELSADSWNKLLESTGPAFFYLKTDEAFHAVFNHSLRVRGIGLQAVVDQEGQYYITKPLHYLFDGVFFIRQTVPAAHISLVH